MTDIYLAGKKSLKLSDMTLIFNDISSPQVEASVRAILVPRVSDASGLEQSTTSPKATLYGLDGAVAPLGLSAFDSHSRVLSVQTVRSSALDKIQDLLARGERTTAYRYAH